MYLKVYHRHGGVNAPLGIVGAANLPQQLLHFHAYTQFWYDIGEMKRKGKRIQSPIKQKILLLLLAGAALSLTRTGKQQIKIISSIPKELRKIDRQYLYRLLHEFHHHRLVDWVEKSDGSITLSLSEKGKITAKTFYPDDLIIKRPPTWDKRWRVVIYDIPDKKKKARDALRHKLTELGFKEWQKSVFIHPYPCQDEINFIIEFFDVRSYVRYAELINLTNESELKLHFKL